MKRSWSKSSIVMDTVVTIQAVSDSVDDALADKAIDEAIQCFYEVERIASRFDKNSEVMRLLSSVGKPVQVSAMLFEQIRFALTMAQMTGGAFDPTVGGVLEQAGFNRHYLTGEKVSTSLPTGDVSYQDVILDEHASTVCLKRPLVLDLGAVAKGYALDLACPPLRVFDGYFIDAGGDVLVSGENEHGQPWGIGIRHPSDPKGIWCVATVPERASICTSGSYFRRNPNDPTQHHIVDPLSQKSRGDLVSCTVVAPFAMMADAISTATFVLGVERGIELLEACDVDGLFVTSDLEQYTTQGMKRYLYG